MKLLKWIYSLSFRKLQQVVILSVSVLSCFAKKYMSSFGELLSSETFANIPSQIA
jgi:hypothetical protein